MNAYLQSIAERARGNNLPAPGDFRGPDGLLYCGVCKEPKESILPDMDFPVPCACRCKRDERDKEAEEKRREQNEQRRDLCFSSPQLKLCRIEKADNSKAAQTVRKYIAIWETVKAENIGLLLWGGVGTGKSYLAACIANAVIDDGDSARMRTLGEVILGVQESAEKNKYITELCNKPLLVLDDLGAERDTTFGAEVIYTLIDKRYQAGKPLVVTTNISLLEMKQSEETGKSRLYDRILEMCVPVKVDGESRRKANAADKMQRAKALLLGEGENE